MTDDAEAGDYIEDDPVYDSYGQEAIQMIDGDYLATLARMVAEVKTRNDPTLAIALSVGALEKLVTEVLAARSVFAARAAAVKYQIAPWDEDRCRPVSDYHADPHRGCVLR